MGFAGSAHRRPIKAGFLVRSQNGGKCFKMVAVSAKTEESLNLCPAQGEGRTIPDEVGGLRD